MKEGIAIVGMSALFPGADDLAGYWQNILDGVDATSEAEDSWSSPYYDPASNSNDRIYTRRGGFLKERAQFNPAAFGVMPNTVDGTEPDHFVALKLAQDALADAGYGERPFDRKRTGVIIGHATLLNRGNVTLLQHGMMVDQTLVLLKKLQPELSSEQLEWARAELKKSLPPFDADVAPGMTPNVLTGRIANRLDLMGPNYIMDAACASSLLAVEQSCRELLSGRCDMMLTGGVNISTSAQVFMVFCRLGALSRSGIRPFSQEASGTLLGEGAGLMVLKRLSDAERDGDRIYAVIRGLGASSDGKGLGLMAPRFEGEVLALERAYEDAGVAKDRIGLLEAHGTGIPLGDRTEIRSLTHVFGTRQGEMPRCGIGSVKSMISHTIPAAGAASMIKTALALYHKTLPPTLCDEVSPELELEKTPFYVNNVARPWIHGGSAPRCAGVNSFGFGGVNAHAVLEEYPAAPRERHYQHWPSELLVISAADRAGVVAAIDGVLAYAAATPQLDLGALAQSLSRKPAGSCRLALVAKSAEDLRKKLNFARERLAGGKASLRTRDGTVYTEHAARPRIAFMFPGEGAQYSGMLADLCLHFPEVREHYDQLDEAFQDEAIRPSDALFPPPTALSAEANSKLARTLYDVDIGSGVVGMSCLALHQLLERFGVHADVMVGHSTGEFASLTASGAVRFASRRRFADSIVALREVYRALEDANSIPRGALLTIGALAPDRLQELLAAFDGRVLVALDNCANQVVLYGTPEDIETARKQASDMGGIPAILPFDRAYHTPLFEGVSQALQPFYAGLDMATPRVPLYSCASVASFPDEPDAIRALAAAQWSSPVRFRETVESMYEDGVRVFIEVGPNSNLTAFANDILRGRDALALATNSQNRPGLEQLQMALGELFARGLDLDFSPLFDGRHLSEVHLEERGGKEIAKPGRRLLIDLPRLDLNEAVVSKLRVAKPAAQKAAIPDTAIVPASGNAADATTNARTALLQGHFSLMQQFLAQQQKLFAAQGAGGSVPPGVAVAGEVVDFPMLGRVVEQSEGHLLAERRFGLETDPFLGDHVFGGPLSDRQPGLVALPVMPFTASMEMLAEAACKLAGGGVVAEFMDVRGSRWLALDQGELILQARVERTAEPGRYQGRLFQRNGEAMVLVFETQIRLAPTYAPAPPPSQLPSQAMRPSHWGDADLYRTGMFHGPMFQSVKHICGHMPDAIEADARVPDTSRFFANHAARLLTPVALLDAVGQLVAYWYAENHLTTDFNSFPFHIDRITLFAPPPVSGQNIKLRGKWRESGPGQLEGGCDIITDAGLLARVEGMRERVWGNIPYPSYYRCRVDPRTNMLSEPWAPLPGIIARRVKSLPASFLNDSFAIWKRALAHLMLGARERSHWYGLPEGLRTQWLLGRIAAKDAVRQWANERFGLQLAPVDVEILPDRLGKPLVYCAYLPVPAPAVSISHTGEHAFAVLSEQESIGLDLEYLPSFTGELEVAASFDASEQACFGQWPERRQAVLALWGAREAAAKAAGTGLLGKPSAWRIQSVAKNHDVATVVYADREFQVKLGKDGDWCWAICRTSSNHADLQGVQ